MNNKKRIIELVSLVMNTPVDEISEQSTPDTIENWDSLMHLNLIAAIEEEFRISLTDDEIVDLLSVEKIIDTVNQKSSQ